MEHLNQVLEVGKHWEINRSSLSVFEVHNDISMMVDLQKRFCSCYQWQIKGFLCELAVAAIIKDDGNPYDYVEDFFTDEYYKSSYSFPIYSILNIERHDINEHEEIVVEPPLTKKQSGRPKLKMMKSIGEQSRSITCGRCHRIGQHNSRTCQAQI
ncbi:uncharacterized protein LOC125469361 [Pyrus x bretschneideri]|uniref:uncharacterized protein LOC125469361 n=1 Tax=Pyrus x bretschneideri TaxID=225117 RepID=UPI00202DE104|nr:uncharacterized protein LOC125469361 [Pyrus x bretschneideri]